MDKKIIVSWFACVVFGLLCMLWLSNVVIRSVPANLRYRIASNIKYDQQENNYEVTTKIQMLHRYFLVVVAEFSSNNVPANNLQHVLQQHEKQSLKVQWIMENDLQHSL